jgi:hypothetical protein
MSRTQKYLLGFVLLLVLCLGGYVLYSKHKTQTPLYSVQMAQTAVAKSNWQDANKHLDLDALYAQVFDEVVVPSLQARNNGVISDVARDILSRMRGGFVTTMLTYTKSLVESKDKNAVTPPAHVFVRRFLDLSHLPYCSLSALHDTAIDGDTATVGGKLSNSLLSKDFPIEISLKKLPDGTWKVFKVNNLTQLLSAMEKAQGERLATLNQPLQEKVNQQISLVSSTFELKTTETPWPSAVFLYHPTFTFLAEKTVGSFMGQIQILDSSGKVLYNQKYIETGPFEPGTKQPFAMQWTLNPGQPKEKALIDTQGKNLTIKENILGVIFTDGTSVKLLETLPDKK